jgi:DNA-binding IclR family transcriptional regulator
MLNDDRSFNSPQSVTRVLRILEVLCADSAPVGLAQLSRAVDAPKSSVAALMRGLTEADVVVAAEGAYRLGPGAFALGSALLEARRRLHSSDIVREGMRRLAERSGETVLFAVLDAGGETMTYVDVIESRNAVRFAVSAGDRRPLYCTSGGRVLLATLDERALHRYLEHLGPKKLTASTVVDKLELAEIIATARKEGVAQTINEAADGVSGTASPIRAANDTVLGALIVAAPSSRFGERSAELARLVREEAAAISRMLGHSERRRDSL